MTKRIKFTAEFSAGPNAIRVSDRKEYTHAWRMIARRGPIPADGPANGKHHIEGSFRIETGFATSRDLAERAARSAFASLSPTRGRYARALDAVASRRTYTLVSAEVVAVTREG